jgi:hypothetical protein
MTTLFYSILNFFVGLLPNSSGFPTEIETALTTAIVEGEKWSFIVPFETIFRILAIVFVIEGGILSYKVLSKILSWLRGGG